MKSSSHSSARRAQGGVRTPAVIELVARRFALLAEPMRLRLIQSLFEHEKGAGALVEEVRGTQANISRHLTALVHGGVLVRKKHGIHVRYLLADSSVVGLCELVCAGLKQQLKQQAGALAGSGADDGMRANREDSAAGKESEEANTDSLRPNGHGPGGRGIRD